MLGLGHCTFSVRPPHRRSRFDLIGADAPERLGVVQISGKNVDMNIMVGTYTRGGARNSSTQEREHPRSMNPSG